MGTANNNNALDNYEDIVKANEDNYLLKIPNNSRDNAPDRLLVIRSGEMYVDGKLLSSDKDTIHTVLNLIHSSGSYDTEVIKCAFDC